MSLPSLFAKEGPTKFINAHNTNKTFFGGVESIVDF